MAVALVCPNLQCRTLLRVPDKARGKRVRCPECGGVLIVPKNAPREGTTRGQASQATDVSP